MSRKDFETDWTPFRDALLDRYPSLTEEILEDADGNVDTLASAIAQGRGTEARDERAELVEFLAGPMPADAYAAPQRDGAAIGDAGDYVPDGEEVLDDDARFGDDGTAATPMGRAV